MKILFRDIPKSFFKARLSEVKEGSGAFGPYLRLIFTITEKGELNHYRFSGFVKPIPLKHSKFYRWITNILGEPPDDKFNTNDILGKECLVFLSKHAKYYSVTEVSMIQGK